MSALVAEYNALQRWSFKSSESEAASVLIEINALSAIDTHKQFLLER